MDGVVKYIQDISAFEFQLMLKGSLGASVPCTLHIYYGTLSKLSKDNYVMIVCFSRWMPLLTLNETFSGFCAHPNFYSHDLLIPGNT